MAGGGRYLRASWWKYLVFPLLLSLVWPYFFSLKDRPKENEDLQIFLSARKITGDGPLPAAKEALKKKGILSIRTYCIEPSQSLYSAILESQGLRGSDVLLLTEGDLKTYGPGNWFLPLSEEIIPSWSTEWETFEEEGVGAIGICVRPGEGGNSPFDLSWVDWGSEEEPIYLCVNARLPNAGKGGQKAKEEDDEAIDLCNAILEYGHAREGEEEK